MRRTKVSGLLFLGLSVACVAACGGESSEVKPAVAPSAPTAIEPVPPPPGPTTAETAPPVAPKRSPGELQLAAVKASFDAWNAGDAKQVAAQFADGGTLAVAGMPELKGREAIQTNVQKTMDAFPKGKMAVWRTWQKGDMIAVEWVMNGTHTGELMGLKGTEKPVGFHGASLVWTNADGAITQQHDYFDLGTIMGQVGATKEKARSVPALPASSEAHASKGASDEEKNVDLAKAFYGSMEKKSEADFIGFMTDTTEYEDFTQPAVSKGKADAKKFFATFTKAFPDVKQQPTTIFGVEDVVISEVTMTGTHKGPLGRLPPTKKAVSLKALDVLQIKDGKMVKGWTYSNAADMGMQLGLVKPPSAPAAKGAARIEPGQGADAKAQQGRPSPAGAATPKPTP